MPQQQPIEYAQTQLTDDLCEATVLGTLLSSPYAISSTRETLTEDCFYNAKHRAVFHAIKELDSKGEKADIVTVWQELQKHSPAIPIDTTDYFTITQSPPISIVDEYAARLVDLSKRRRFEMIAAKFRQAAHDETVAIEDLLIDAREDIEGLLTVNGSQTTKIADSLKDVKAIIKDNKEGKKSPGTKTGFKQLDKYGGFHGADLIIVAGDTSAGKTAWALSSARNMVLNGEPIAYYSMEMQHYQLTARILAMQSGVTSSAILYKPLSDEDTRRIDFATEQLVNKNLYYDDKSLLSIDTIMASIRSLHLKYKIKGAYIDYLQIIDLGESRNVSKEQATANAARKLKNLAKSLNIWIVALSQLSRRNARLDPDPMPTMDRLRGSGQIAEAADTVLLVFRPEYYGADVKFPKPYKEEDTHNKAMIIVPKGRNVGVGSFICNFIPELTLFTEEDVGNLPVISYGDNKPVIPSNDDDTQNDYGDNLPF